MRNEEGLDRLFAQYRSACPDPEASAGFMPGLWKKIEGRQGFWYLFGHLGKTMTTASAAICLVLLLLNLISAQGTYSPIATYADALMAEHSAEKTYYTEAIRNNAASDEGGAQQPSR